MIEGIPCEVVEVLQRTGMAGEAYQVKVRVLDVQASSSSGIKYGLVVNEVNKEFFNRGRVNKVFDVELLDKLIIPNKTILQYTTGGRLASENVTIKDDSKRIKNLS